MQNKQNGRHYVRKALSLVLALVLTLSFVPASVFAGDNPSGLQSAVESGKDPNKQQVRVIVENKTFTPDSADWDSGFWYGTLVDQWVDIDDESTMMSCVVAALEDNGYSQTGAESNYLEQIAGLGQMDGGPMSGWMGTLNDWFVNEGFDGFTVEKGTLAAGDIIDVVYTSDMGEDNGASFGNNDKTLKALTFSEGTLAPAFDAAAKSYTLSVSGLTDEIYVTPTAANKNFQARIFIGETEYKRTAAVPVSDGTVITVKCGDPAWPSMNGGDLGTADQVPAETYTVTVSKPTPAENADITVTVSSKGVLAEANDGSAMVSKNVTVEDLDKDGKLTVNEALIAAHKAYDSEEGYAASNGDWGLSVTKLWGTETYNTLFFVNGVGLSMGVGTDTVKAGDELIASVNADDANYADWFTGFDKKSATVAAGEELTLTLKGGMGMAYPADFTQAVSGVKIGTWNNGAFTQNGSSVTDTDGKCTLSFAETGTYIVTAAGSVKAAVDTDWDPLTPDVEIDCPIIAPYCIVTVVPAQTVVVKAAPSTVALTFTDAAGKTITATDDGVVNKFHQYTLKVADGTYNYLGTDGTVNLGGDSFTVNGAAATIVVVRDNVRYNGASLAADGDYTFTIKNGEKEIVYGTPYVTSNIKYTPTLLIAGTAYSGSVSLNAKWNEEFYLTNNGAFTVNLKNTLTSAQTANLPIAAYKILKVTASKNAAVKFYKQESNYVVTDRTSEITQTVDNNDGTMTYIIKGTAAHSNYQYRATESGKLTQAGYLKDNEAVVVSELAGKTPATQTSDLEYDNNSILLNIDDNKDTNELSMKVGDSYKLRAWRAPWEIINSTTANQMIEPDMHYQILSGSDVIEIEATDVSEKGEAYCSGNASGNWMNVKAKAEGTAIVAVWYDAINVTGATPGGFFGASDPARYGVFVVNVGNDTTVSWNPASSDGDWDSEFDTVYYVGDNGIFTIAPENVTSVTVQNVYGSSLGTVRTVAANEDNSYSVPVKTGANVIAATTAEGTDYFVVRAKQIRYVITNNTTEESKENDAPAISTGDSVTIALNGLDMPVPKMSGIYNPGYMGTAKILYKLNDASTLLSAGTQYDFSSNPAGNAITFTALVPGTNSLKGYISLSSMGDNFGNHRNTTDSGRAANTNAGEVFGQFGIIPDIEFAVTDTGAKPTYEDAVKLDAQVLVGLSAYNTGVALMGNINAAGKVNGTLNDNYTQTWTKTTSQMNGFTLQIKANAACYTSKLQLKYWYEGEAAKTVDIASGVTNVISDISFVSCKKLNMQLIIDPCDETIGAAKTYSFTVNAKSGSHTLTETEAKSATHAAPGNEAYWTCSACGKYFSDNKGTAEIEKDSWIIPAVKHVDADFDGICDDDDCKAELGTVKSAALDYTSQFGGAFLHAPKSGASVASNLAELYGYTDGVSYLEAVSVLDVLVQAQIDVYGEEFTKSTAADYLVIGQSGSPDKQFCIDSSVAYGGFLLNHAMANDGTKYDENNYNATTVTTQSVKDGDLVEFFFYEDEMYGDTVNWFSGADKAAAGVPFELTLNGFYAMSASCFKDFAEMSASEKAYAVEDAQIYTVNTATGELTAIEGTVTDEDGKVTLTFAEPGTYTIAAYGTEDCTFTQLLYMTTVEVAPGNLSELAFGSGTSAATKGCYALTPAFDPDVHEYTVYVGDNVNALYAWARLSESGNGQAIKCEYTNTSNVEKSVALTSKKAAGQSLALVISKNAKGNTLTVKAGDQVYTVNIVRIATLSGLTFTNNGRDVALSKTFASATYEYTTVVPGSALLKVNAVPTDSSAAVKLNGGEIGETVPLVWNNGEAELTFEVSYGTAETTSTYTVLVKANTLKGSGTEEDPYLIENVDDMITFRDYVNGGCGFSGEYFKLTSDITLPNGWTPIGDLDAATKASYVDYVSTLGTKSTQFMGIFDGDGHTITVPAGELTAFGSVKNATLKNFNIYGSKIPGYGVVQYWLRNNGSFVEIENVKLLKGTHTMMSGFIGGYESGTDRVIIRNCEVEEGVFIGNDGKGFWAGYERTEALPSTAYAYGPTAPVYQNDFVGSFVGAASGEIVNCVSHATVYGNNYVGGIWGFKGQSMGDCLVRDCFFDGVIYANNYVGGILGSGYASSSAPNTPSATVQNCSSYAKITAADYVGGIFGGEILLKQNWNNGVGYIQNNFFGGQIVCEGSSKGAIIGYFNVLDNCNIISNNYYISGCGAEKGMILNAVEDTNAQYIPGYEIKAGDDPEDLCKAVASEADALEGLNAGSNSSETWAVTGGKLASGADKHIISIYSADLNSNPPKTLNAFDALDENELTVKYNDGTTETIKVSDCEKVDWNFQEVGFRAVQLIYKNAQCVFLLKNTEVIDDPAVAAVDQAIEELGEITLDKEEAVAAVTEEYEKLNDSQKEQLKNEQTLLDAQQSIEDLKAAAEKKAADEKAAKEVDDLIDAIGEVTLDSKDDIEKAEAAYDKLTDDQKALVTKKSELDAAREEYDALKAAADKKAEEEKAAAEKKAADEKAAKEVDDLIDAIGEVTLDSKDDIEKAEAAYDKLTDDQKAFVTKKSGLDEAREEYNRLAEEASKPKIYAMLEGAEQTTKDGNDAGFRSAAEFSKFKAVLVDGKEIGRDCYTVTEGSTIVTLKDSYLRTLEDGEHTLTIASTDGNATTTFTVNHDRSEEKPPKTGDANVRFYALAAGSAAICISAVYLSLKKKKED